MPAKSSFDYAIVRLVPNVEREEFINVGVILFCRTQGYLAARTYLDRGRARALAPDLNLDAAQAQLDLYQRVCHGDPTAGPVAALAQAERFHWLVAPRSTVIQVSPVHSGLCREPSTALERIFREVACTPQVPLGEDAVPLRYLALGDSYTIGEGVAPAERWPAQLVTRLACAGLIVAEPVIIAKTGWTTDQLLAALARDTPEGPFDLVTLLIGVNNQYLGLSIEGYRAEFRSLLAQAIALANGETSRVIVLSIPDWSVTPFANGHDRAQVADQVDRFNAVNRTETTASGCQYVDITGISRQARHDSELLTSDLLHPSPRMYRLWVGRLLPAVAVALGAEARQQ